MNPLLKANFFAAVVSSLVLFSACSSAPDSTSTTSPSTPSAAINQTPSAPKVEVVTESQIQSDSGLAANALDKSDLKKCDEIKLQNMKSQCRYNIVVAEALKKADPKICEQLKSTLEVENCKFAIGPSTP